MSEQNWKRREYETWDEAFRGLAPVIRQQSVRVAAYTQVLFVGACASSFMQGNADGAERMRGQYADLAYKCGLYHQLGKALVPPEYQIWQEDFSEEEQAVYRKYTTDGRLLVAVLQERGNRAKEKRKGELIEQPTRNIPWLMVRETCEQHMERWNGSGYPAGKSGNQISPIAQIVGLAKELDRISAETKSEDPFSDAMAELIAGSDILWSPALIDILRDNREKLRTVYRKYIQYTRTLPKTIPLVEKKKDRAMGLRFRPMVKDGEGTVFGYEAVPWFGAIANRPGETEGAADVEELLKRTDLVEDVSMYFLYEAADAVLRLENCRIPSAGVLLHMLPSFYKLNTQLQNFNQLFEDQPIPKEKLMLTVPESAVLNANKGNLELISRYLRNGIVLVLDDYHPENLPIQRVAELGFRYVRVAPELYVDPGTAAQMKELLAQGIQLIGGNVSDHDTLAWLLACGVGLMSGQLTGIETTEDELIRDALAKER